MLMKLLRWLVRVWPPMRANHELVVDFDTAPVEAGHQMNQQEGVVRINGHEYHAPFPHCDSYVLHAPGECEVCDCYPAAQQSRIERKVNFTGHSEPGFAQCPSEARRPLETIERWHGNRKWKDGEPE